MSWFTELAGKAESLLNNIDAKTGVVLQNKSNNKDKRESPDRSECSPVQNRKRNQKLNLSKNETITGQTKSMTGQTIKSLPPRSNKFQIQSMKTLNTRQTAQNRKRLQDNVIKVPKAGAESVKNNETKDFGIRKRRRSLPADLEDDKDKDNKGLVYEMQSLEVENTMLKNEINVVSREMAELLEKLKISEYDLAIARKEIGNNEKLNHLIKDSLSSQIEELKSKTNEKNLMEIEKHKEHIQELETEVNLLNNKNKHMTERVTFLEEDIVCRESRISKLEKELRQAQTRIVDVESTLNKTTADSDHFVKDWEAYKLRVKNMLSAKDSELKLLRDSSNIREDTKMLMEEIETLKEEKEELSASLSRTKGEQDEARTYITQVEEKYAAAERMAVALREALREEHAARHKVKDQCDELTKELQSLEINSQRTIENLTMALKSKEDELLEYTANNMASTHSSSLNVADYDDIKDDKIQCLTQTLIQRQAKIDSLLADNNVLRIQLGKLESKYKAKASLDARSSHSLLNLQDCDGLRARSHTMSPLLPLSVKVGVMIRRYPIFRTFVIFYMIGLHVWVMTVLLTNTPQDHVPKQMKS